MEHSIAIPGFNIAYKTRGNPDLPPLICIHGWLDNANSFDLITPYLAKHYYVIAFDLPGHGLSSHLPIGCNYHFIDGIYIVLQFIKALGFEKVHLLGHSLGACLASLIAGVSPQHILSLMLIEAIGPFSKPEDTCREQLEDYWIKTNTDIKKEARAFPSIEHAAQLRAKQGYISIELAEILYQRGLEKRENGFFWRHDRRLLTIPPLRMTEGQILDCLKSISSKSSLILADQGFVFSQALLQKRIAVVKDLKVYHLQGGHHIHMEKPGAVAQCLVQ